MAVNTYECLFLLDPNKSSADWDGVMGQVNGIIERVGGEILISQPWGEPKLAYPIKNFRKGRYLLTYFHCEAGKIAEIEQECRLNDVILRQLVLRLHPHIVEDILAHIQGVEAEGEALEGEPATAGEPASD